MENNFSVHLRLFNDRVRVMNQARNKDLVLSAQEARNVQADLFELMALVTKLSNDLSNRQATSITPASIDIEVDGGKF